MSVSGKDITFYLKGVVPEASKTFSTKNPPDSAMRDGAHGSKLPVTMSLSSSEFAVRDSQCS